MMTAYWAVAAVAAIAYIAWGMTRDPGEPVEILAVLLPAEPHECTSACDSEWGRLLAAVEDPDFFEWERDLLL